MTTAYSARSSVYRAIIAVVLVICSACSGDDGASPFAASAGTYQLASIGGWPMPLDLPEDSTIDHGDTLVFVRSYSSFMLTLSRTGRFDQAVRGTYRERYTFDPQWTTSEWSSASVGRWQDLGDSVHFIIDSARAPIGLPLFPLSAPETLSYGKRGSSLVRLNPFYRLSLGHPTPPALLEWVFDKQ